MAIDKEQRMITDSRCRDAVMLYIVLHLKPINEELAFLARVIFSETFLVVLKCIRLENKIEDFQFYNLKALEGITPQENEDDETLGDKLVEWVHETLGEYRKSIDF